VLIGACWDLLVALFRRTEADRQGAAEAARIARGDAVAAQAAPPARISSGGSRIVGEAPLGRSAALAASSRAA
jgi:hypothetical protein